jgi:hypothetical protein
MARGGLGFAQSGKSKASATHVCPPQESHRP